MAGYLLSILLFAGVGESDLTLLYFTAEWCQPCAQMEPTLGELQRAGRDVRRVDVDTRKDLVEHFQVKNLPTLIMLCGTQEVDRMVGVSSFEQVSKRVDRAAARSGSGDSGTRGSASFAASAAVSPNSHAPTPIVRGQSPGVLLASGAAIASQFAMGSLASESQHPMAHPGSRPAVDGRFENGFEEKPTDHRALTPAQAIARAAAATVRIRVDEGNTTAHGTGTVIHVHQSEALVLTCGHLFRDMQPGTQISVDLFAGTAGEINVPSQLIDFKAEEEDVGLIAFQLPVQIEPAEILPNGESPQIGQTVFSFGCDHGQNPSRRDTRITNINRYLGAANVEIAGAPAVGRSGGGLFDLRGRLIGVCNAADANDDEGIYAATQVVYAQLSRLGLEHLIEQSSTDPISAGASNSFAGYQHPRADEFVNSPPIQSPTRGAPLQPPARQHSTVSGQSLDAARRQGADFPATGASQLICIIRDAQGNDRLVTVQGPSPELLKNIENSALQAQ